MRRFGDGRRIFIPHSRRTGCAGDGHSVIVGLIGRDRGARLSCFASFCLAAVRGVAGNYPIHCEMGATALRASKLEFRVNLTASSLRDLRRVQGRGIRSLDYLPPTDLLLDGDKE